MTQTASSKGSPPQHRSAPAAGLDDRIWKVLDQWLEQRQAEMVSVRRRIHAEPEASGHEVATTALVAQMLRQSGLQPRIMADGLGVIADIDLGASSSSRVAIRAELDCVKVDDDKHASYASTRAGLC